MGVGNGFWLFVHPDLDVTITTKGRKRAWLIGYILDPDFPELSNEEVLAQVLLKMDSMHFSRAADRFGGRWVLLVTEGTWLRLFTDPAGYRQVCYTDVKHVNEVICASQPGLIARRLGFELSPEAQRFKEDVFPAEPQYWWPGDTTGYREIRHLPPNHFLDLLTGHRFRFWPNRFLPKRILSDAVKEAAPLLSGMMRAAALRFSLGISLTAGRDTRLILAASREICDEVIFFTLQYWELTDKSPDIQTPKRLLNRLGLSHQLIRSPTKMSSDFNTVYFQNVDNARAVYGPLAQGLWEGLADEMVIVKGNTIPIGKCNYRKRAYKYGYNPESVRPEDITRLTQIGMGHPFALAAYRHWYEGAKIRYGISLLDLLWWEDRECRWQGMSQLEWDITNETFVPFNCRTFLEIMLSLAESDREGPDYRFHEALTRAFWQEAMVEPINPIPFSVKRKIKNAIKKYRHRWFRFI